MLVKYPQLSVSPLKLIKKYNDTGFGHKFPRAGPGRLCLKILLGREWLLGPNNWGSKCLFTFLISAEYFYGKLLFVQAKNYKDLMHKKFQNFFLSPHSVCSKFPCNYRGGPRLAVKCKLEEL